MSPLGAVATIIPPPEIWCLSLGGIPMFSKWRSEAAWPSLPGMGNQSMDWDTCVQASDWGFGLRGCISEWGLKMAASWKWVGIWTGIHERDSAFQTIQGRSVFTTLDWAVSQFRVAECWLPIVSSIWNKLHPLHQSHTVIGPRGWSEAPQASYFWLWTSRSLKSVWDEDLVGLEFLMYFQVQNFVHNLTVETIWTVELDIFV